ncbi:thioesterase II family protein [Spirillospora sp. CA-255316]
MLTIADHLIREAERRGVRLLADGGRVRLDGPPDALDERFTTLVHANGEAILRRVDPSRARDGWLRPITRGPGAALLFVIPAAGTGAGRYQVWREAAPPGLEIVAVQPPGREDRLLEPAFTEVGPLADEIARRIAAWTAARPDRPCGIFGHSTGALVGYEVVRRITSGPAPRLLAVAASPPPDLARTDVAGMADEELLEAMAEWTGTPLDMLASPDVAAAALPVLRADLSVHVTCRRAREDAAMLDIPIIGLAGRADVTAPDAECAAWAHWTTGGFALRRFDGGHFFPVTEAGRVLDALAEALLPGR